MNAAKIHATKPATPKHLAGMHWFASLTHAYESCGEAPITFGSSLKRSIEFYRIFAETADERYLGLCEDFLKDALAG